MLEFLLNAVILVTITTVCLVIVAAIPIVCCLMVYILKYFLRK